MSEGHDAAEAEQQVVRAGEERHAQQLHHEHGVDDLGQPRHDHQGEHGGGDEQANRSGRQGKAALHAEPSRPNRPLGRSSSTSAISTKITVLEASE